MSKHEKSVKMEKIKIKYDGCYPNLCRGKLVVIINRETFKFPEYCLSSGGSVFCTGEDYETTTGLWCITEWPNNFPEHWKEAVVKALNEQVQHGCCGGCI